MQKDEKQKILLMLARGETSRETAAAALDVSTRTVNRWMNSAGLVRKTKVQTASDRREARKRLKEVTKGMTPQEIVEIAEVTLRTAYRWINE